MNNYLLTIQKFKSYRYFLVCLLLFEPIVSVGLRYSNLTFALQTFSNLEVFTLGCSAKKSLFLIKLLACNFIEKESLAQLFPCEFCEISNNNFPYRTPPVAASGNYMMKRLRCILQERFDFLTSKHIKNNFSNFLKYIFFRKSLP